MLVSDIANTKPKRTPQEITRTHHHTNRRHLRPTKTNPAHPKTQTVVFVVGMESMEAILTSGSEDHLIEGLSFKPTSNTANCVLETRQVTYQTESGKRFDPVSSRVIRFRLADHGFLEASSVNLALTIQNKGDQTITPICQLMLLCGAHGSLHRASSSRIESNWRPHQTSPRG